MIWRFMTLMALSTFIAAFGLLADSPAVVIGAMLVAPLMTPILGVAISLIVDDRWRLLQSLTLIGAGVLLAIVAASLVSALAPGTVTADDLTGELLARTTPSLLDLGVAVAAGLAAGYVLTHPQAGSSLPGVAVAVALVPPLATVGIAVELGAREQMEGALLLFATNLVAIVGSAMVVALASGVAPIGGQRSQHGSVRTGLLVAATLLVAVAVPLTLHTINVIEDARFTRRALAAIEAWDPNADIVEVSANVTDNGRGDLSVVMATRNEPLPAWRLAELLRDRTERAVSVEVAYLPEVGDAAFAD
jgi:uncharacterized hydrophobic protein (TIGR00271 family)